MGCGASTDVRPSLATRREFPHLSSSTVKPIELHYDVVVIGSGYGGGIAACRAARAGLDVCVLEKGKEWRPGDFPEELLGAIKQTNINGKGDGNELYDIYLGSDVSVVRGCGLGGTSLINANVCLEGDVRLYTDDAWPQDFRNDSEKFTKDMDRARDMLNPKLYPQNCTKFQSMGEIADAYKQTDIASLPDIEDLDKIFKIAKEKSDSQFFCKVPLAVNFDKRPVNHVGVPQPPCNGCGNCVGGCNTGAKNTVNMNYLADAKFNGADIFTQVRVRTVEPWAGGGKWTVYHQMFTDGKWADTRTVTSEIVVLGAGTLGSSEILLRSQEEHSLALSPQLGKGFDGNGDQLGISYNGDKPINGLGVPSAPNPLKPPGPCITSMIDFRNTLERDHWNRGFILEDGTPAVSIVPALKAMLTFSGCFSIDPDPNDNWEQLANKITGEAMDNTLPILGIGYDDPDRRNTGRIYLEKDDVQIEYKGIGETLYYKQLNQVYLQAAKTLGGTFVQNPGWSDALEPLFGAKNTISVHPLGGCVMGESGRDGVVNHKGQVFIGDSDGVHKGLYVMDGSVIPHSVGVNPLVTISGVAERCMRLMAEDYYWGPQNYDFVQNPDDISWNNPRKPGLTVTEYMGGDFTPAGKKSVPMSIVNTLLVKDLEHFLYEDAKHTCYIYGIVKCKGLDRNDITASGTMDLFANDTGPDSEVGMKLMSYRIKLQGSGKNKVFFFEGKKFIRRDSATEIGWKDTTTLYVTIHKGNDDTGPVLGTAVLTMTPNDLIRSVSEIEILNNSAGFVNRLKWKVAFIKLFLGQIWEVYSPFSAGKKLDPDAPPRRKRPLVLPDPAQPVVHPFSTEDGKNLWLTRYEGGPKGPVLLVHGLGVSSIIFSLDTVRKNFVEYLVSKKYDVWCIEWRGSIQTRYAETPFSLDDVSRYDIPAGVDRVLHVTGHKNIMMVVHCTGSLAFFGSLLGGHCEGKIRCVLACEVAFLPMPSKLNQVKAGLHLPSVAKAIGLDTFDDEEKGLWYDSLASKISGCLADLVLPAEEECKSVSCHRATLLYGPLWRHSSLNQDTHNALHEILGVVNAKALKHIARQYREGKLVSATGEDIYVPGYPKQMTSPEFKDHIRYLDIPMCFTIATKNAVYDPGNMEKVYGLLKSEHPDQYYELLEIESYGHLDSFLGKHANTIAFPKFINFLDRYAHTSTEAETIGYWRAVNLLDKKPQMKENHKLDQQDQRDGIGGTNIQHPDIFDDDSDEDEPPMDPKLAAAVREQTEPNATKVLDNAFPWDVPVVWKRKSTKENRTDTYEAPRTSPVEGVFIVPVEMGADQVKREIYVISDTHFGSHIAERMADETKEFMSLLVGVAHTIHTLVLNGDILEMWYDSMDEAPKTMEKFVEEMKSDDIPAVKHFRTHVHKLAEEHNVNVFYVRGNHDHEITEKAVHDIFGTKVTFIPGILIYEIRQEQELYRVRFEHGHDFDIFNTYRLAEESNGLLCDRPFGYYVSRAAASNPDSNLSCIAHFFLREFPTILESLGFDLFGSLIMKILSSRRIEKALLERLLQNVRGREIGPTEKFVMDENGDFLTASQVMKYRVIKRIIDKYGYDRAFDMFKHSMGDYTDFIETCEEDVVCVGHSHRKQCKILPGRKGPVIYGNSGTWTISDKNYSFLRITPPWNGHPKGHGFVEVSYNRTTNMDE